MNDSLTERHLSKLRSTFQKDLAAQQAAHDALSRQIQQISVDDWDYEVVGLFWLLVSTIAYVYLERRCVVVESSHTRLASNTDVPHKKG